jgi:outer membrane protein assembly factor BamA
MAVVVKEVQIKGNHRTQRSFFDNELAVALTRETFPELHSSLIDMTKRMESFGIFSSVETVIKVQPSGMTDVTIPVTVVIEVKEKKVLFSKVESYFGSEGTALGASAQCTFRNLTGFGEMSKLSYGSNNTGSREWLLGVNFPSVTSSLYSLDTMLRIYEDKAPLTFSSFSKGIASLSMQLNSKDRRHSLEMMAAFRDEIPKSFNFPPPTSPAEDKNNFLDSSFVPSFSKRSLLPFATSVTDFDSSSQTLYSLSPSTKSSIAYSFTAIDSRDSSSNPSRGAYLSGKIELALPPGSARFLRVEGCMEKHLNLSTTLSSVFDKLPSPVVLSLCSSFGSLLRSQDRNINFSDRYFQSGGLSLRGWQQAGLGARSANAIASDSMGGTLRWNALTALSVPLPFHFPTSECLKTFAYLNCGTVLDFPLGFDLFLRSVRVSAGCGLSYSFGPARLEATYSLPIRHSEHDRMKSFQLGIGLSINGIN